MIEPAQKDDGFLADVGAARREPGRLHLWWLGQSGFLVQWAGRHLLLDPYLSDSLTRKYAGTDKPHERMTARVVDPARLDFLDAVTSSHNHTDHLDPETLQAIARANPGLVMVCPEANRAEVRARSGLTDDRVIGLDAGDPDGTRPGGAPGEADVAGFRIRAVPAAHEAMERDAAGCLRQLGYVVGAGPWTLYHSGDTVWYPGMETLLAPLRVDVALLPINGRAPERRVAGNLWGDEAARLARATGAGRVVPCHFGMFAFNTADPALFVRTCHELGQGHVVLRAGERWSP